jgi:hypothetical protein
MRRDNAAVGIAGVKIPKTRGYRPVSRPLAAWDARAPSDGIALEAVSRRVEVLRLGPQHVRNGRIRIERVKGTREVDIPPTPELAVAIDAMPKVHLTFIVSQWGKPYMTDARGKLFGRWATGAGLPKRCRVHGLKKGGMRRLAQSGGTTHERMAISGHMTLSAVQRYPKDAGPQEARLQRRQETRRERRTGKPGYYKWQTSS